MNKRDRQLLKQVFESKWPAQIGKSKAVTSLHERGLIEPSSMVLGGAIPCTIKGWKLTDLGLHEYLQSEQR